MRILCFVFIVVINDSQQQNMLTSWNFGDESVPYLHRDAISGYNAITDEFFMFGGGNNGGIIDPAIVYKFEYETGNWSELSVNGEPTFNRAQGYTQYNNIIYYYTSNEINTLSMNEPYDTSLVFSTSSIASLINGGCCLSSDINGHLFMSSGMCNIFV